MMHLWEYKPTRHKLQKPLIYTDAQLRSGYCRLLGSYKSIIKKDSSLNVCADCGNTPQEVKHLFACPAHPTTFFRQTYGAEQWTPSGNSDISRRETYTETNQDLRRTTTTKNHIPVKEIVLQDRNKAYFLYTFYPESSTSNSTFLKIF